MSTIIEVHNLEKQYAPAAEKAVKGISFNIEQGEIFSLLGPNGAGKTTTISMISCLLSPTAGDAIVAGHSITKAPMKVKQSIGVVPQEIALYDSISAQENLLFWGRMYGLSGSKLHERVQATLKISGLEDRAGDKVKTFSGGMKRRLNIAVGLLHEPQVLYMDEPTVGIDPQSRRRILDTVKELNGQGLTVLYTTHYMEEAEELSNRIGIIDHGQLIALGTQAELTQMVGRFDTITVQMDGVMAGEQLLAGVGQLPGVHQADGSVAQLILQTQDAKQLLPQLLNWTDGQGLRLRGVEIQAPNLEAVFLHLTGHGLRD
ncbi:MAG: ATP-binding cassette domain-containing protein [Anaerolineae bacterium]|nr:ATP-binding cassette domain-containing protein [Anaerolineae bacterium]